MVTNQISTATLIMYSIAAALLIATAFFPVSITMLTAISAVIGWSIIVFAATKKAAIKIECQEQADKKVATAPWLARIMLIQILLLIPMLTIFLNLFNAPVVINDVNVSFRQLWLLIWDWHYYFWGPFPFALSAAVTASLCYYRYVHPEQDLNLKALSKNRNASLVMRALIAIGSGAAVTIILVWSLSAAVMLLANSFAAVFNFNLINDYPLLVNYLMLPFFVVFQNYNARIKLQRYIDSRKNFISMSLMMLLSMLALIIIMLLVVNYFNINSAPLHILPWIMQLLPEQTPEYRLGFLFWSYGVCAAVVAGVYIAKVSYGKSFRQIIAATMFLPLLVVITVQVTNVMGVNIFAINLSDEVKIIINTVMAIASILILLLPFNGKSSTRFFVADITKRGRVYSKTIGCFAGNAYFLTSGLVAVYISSGIKGLTILLMPLSLIAGAGIFLLSVAFAAEMLKIKVRQKKPQGSLQSNI